MAQAFRARKKNCGRRKQSGWPNGRIGDRLRFSEQINTNPLTEFTNEVDVGRLSPRRLRSADRFDGPSLANRTG